jgi:hypothetical protein
VVDVKVAMHPASQRRPMESSEPDARSGEIWARHAEIGSRGSVRSAVWVDMMLVPFGILSFLVVLLMSDKR